MNPPWSYSILGLRVRADQRLPGLVALPPHARADVDVWLGCPHPLLAEPPGAADETRYVSRYRDARGTPNLRVWVRAGGRFFHLLCHDGIGFLVDREGREVWATRPEGRTAEDVADHLLGLLFGFVHLLRGSTGLHGSAVAVGVRAAVILGPSGAGKSTTAAALARRGYPVLTDDLVVLEERDGEFWVQPGDPGVRLWPDSVGALFGRPDALPCYLPDWDKRKLDLTERGYSFQGEPLPLGGVYLLGGRSDGPAAPTLEVPAAREGLIALVGNTYLDVLLDPAMRARALAFLGRVAARFPPRRLTPHRDPGRLPALLDLLLHDLGSPPPPARVPETYQPGWVCTPSPTTPA